MTLFRYDPGVLERFPMTVGGLLHTRDSCERPPRPRSPPRRAEQERTLELLGDRPVGTLPSIAAWRRAFAAFGVEPTRYETPPRRCCAD